MTVVERTCMPTPSSRRWRTPSRDRRPVSSRLRPRRGFGQVVEEDVAVPVPAADAGAGFAALAGAGRDDVQDVVAAPEPDDAGVDAAVAEGQVRRPGGPEVRGRALELGRPALSRLRDGG